jgi:hypothetical protein
VEPQAELLHVKRGISQEQAASVPADTKRKVLSITASIFDPLGLPSPSVIVYKTFLQQMWQDNLSGNTQLPTIRHQKWQSRQKTIPQLLQIRINRKVIPANARNIELHAFCDSSELAYGAWLFIRSIDVNQHISSDLLCSTTRVAPQKKLTIPRLELCAVNLLAKLFRKATKALNITFDDVYFLSDSSVVLTWIQGTPNKSKTFIGNRVVFIKEETASATWKHVPTDSNPADLISRGLEPATLAT